MATRPESSDLAVDELKRRARRRLVGAIVLALAAAVILPLLLESDPKPLGDDVSIRIPPIDNGKFVNPLSPGKGPEGAAPGFPEPKTGAAPVPKKPIADAERRVVGETEAKTQPVAPVATQAPREADAKPTVVPSVPESKTVAKTDAPGAPTDTAATGGGFVVQLGAFADAKVAADLATTLKSSGFSAYTEALTTGQGAVQRVRVGPYASRDAADAALAKLKSAGYSSAQVTSAK
jgi:DedD protein